MKTFWIALLVLLAPLAMANDQASATWPKDTSSVVVRAYFEDADVMQKFAAYKAPWKVDRKKGYLIVDVDELEFNDMIEAGFRVEIDTLRTLELNTPRAIDGAQRAGIPGFACYRTVAETFATGAQLAAEYPNLVSWIDVGDSWEKTAGFGGDDMMVLKLTNSAITGDKPKLFNTSAIHAREYTTAELNTRFAEYLINNYGVDADATWLLDNHEIHLMLHANPDGRRKAQTGLSWRKNGNQNYCGATSNDRGADLNRNFEFGWGCCNGSSGNQCSGIYRGPAPGSEPEVTSVQAYLRAIFADSRGPNDTDAAPADTSGIYIDIHSFSELVLWPWGNTFTVAPNGLQMQTLGRRLAFYNGYEPQQATELYITDGTTDDFAYGDLGIAAYTYELGTTFFQDCGTFESTIFPDNLQSLIYAAKSARAPYILPGGPKAEDVGLSSSAIAPGQAVSVTARIDDTQFRNSNGTESTQPINAAQVFVDTPPWAAGATPIDMMAADGSFNSTAENVSATLDTSGLSQGRHTVYVHGQDTSGTWGVVSAEFLYVIDPATAPRISGRVMAADTGAGLAATVNAGSFSTTTDANGDCDLLLLAGCYDISVVPDDTAYGEQTLADVAAVNSQVTTQNFALYPFCAIFSDDMETAEVPWTAQGNWARTSSDANSGSFSYTDSPGGEYGNNVIASLISPALDLSQIGTISLDFASLCDTEATYDFCNVDISRDGSEWEQVASYDGLSSSFVDRSLTITSLAGAAAAQVRFRFTSDVTVTEDGWYVDDVVVRGAGAQCVTTTDLDGDGVSDMLDNCTNVVNADQQDTNGDGFGNACDADLNNDNIVNVVDLGILRTLFFQSGALDSDFNGDGVTNVVDLGLMRTMFFQPPGPSGLVAP